MRARGLKIYVERMRPFERSSSLKPAAYSKAQREEREIRGQRAERERVGGGGEGHNEEGDRERREQDEMEPS